MQRRTLLKLGVVSGGLLAVAGGAWWSWRPALTGRKLTPAGEELVAAVAAAVLDGLLPAAGPARDAAIRRHLRRFEDTLAGLPQHLLAEVEELLTVLASPPGRRLLVGLSAPWSAMPVAELQTALQSMRTSTLTLRQQAYHALRDLTNAAWFADPEAWGAIGYPGPQPI